MIDPASANDVLPERLARQLEFLVQADRLKSVSRRCLITDGSRSESAAEHSWHLALMALILHEHSVEDVDLMKVLRLVIAHDLVEIHAGDTFAYDEVDVLTKRRRECDAADVLFDCLPPDQARHMRALWDEYEEASTIEARFAKAIDRLAPVILNHATAGGSWRIHSVSSDRVRARNATVAADAPALQLAIDHLINESVRLGFLV